MHADELPSLSVIIPLRENDNVDVAERLRWKRIPTWVEVIVVDDGSKDSAPIEAAVKELGWTYLYLQTCDAPFSLARARNRGIRAATGEFLYFEDVDFLHQGHFYSRLQRVASNMDAVPFNFAAVPALFLTEAASDNLIESLGDGSALDSKIDDYLAQLPFINPDEPNELCASFAPVGSNILVRRDLCFHVGLFDEFFNSWGGEDRDFIFKLLNHNSSILKPRDFSATKKWKIHRTNAYEGWRSIYRLHGDWLRDLGIYAVHLYHPDNAWKDPQMRRANFTYAETKAREVASGHRKLYPEPLPETAPNVFIGRNPVFYNDAIMQALGSVKVIDPDRSIAPSEFASSIEALAPIRVFFQNPYGNEWLLGVWRTLTAAGIRCVCAERGAFPNSIYFDEGGFCCDSDSYQRRNWESCEPVDARRYLADLRSGGSALEPQGTKEVAELKEKIDPSKRSVLVVLQSLTDATTLHFSSPMADYSEFLQTVRDLCDAGRYNVLIKNHPLNTRDPISGVGIKVDQYPIYDLFDIADAVVTLNSGAGLLALGAGRQVITLGTSFYAHDGLAEQANDLKSLMQLLDVAAPPDDDAVNRFYGYLLNSFYSFADWVYGSRAYSDATKMSTMADVRFKKIVIGNISALVTRPKMNDHSIIMDPYALDRYLHKAGVKTTAGQAVPRASDRMSAAQTITAAKFESDARSAVADREFALAGYLFDQAYKIAPKETRLLRCAAEAYDKAHQTDRAIQCLQTAAAQANSPGPILRRHREMKRSRLLRLFLKETPYPGITEIREEPISS